MERTRVILADDHEDFLRLATRLLEPEFDVVKTVAEGQELIDESARLNPDLLVVDISMPAMTGIEAAKHLRRAGSSAKIVFLTVHADPDYVRAAFGAGAQGYVVKSRLASDLPSALREVMVGKTFISPTISMEDAIEAPTGGETS